MAKRTLFQWLDELNNYGRLRIFFNPKEAQECQRTLRRIEEILRRPEVMEASAFLRIFSKEIENQS